jgi:glycosyltransferase involved in cell wall biosynthesis
MTNASAPLAGARLAVAVTAARSAEFYAGQLAALRNAGAEVWFLSSPSPEVEAQCAYEGARFVPIIVERAPSPWNDARALIAVERALARIRPQLLVAGTPKMGLLATLAAAARRVPVRVHTLHGLRYETSHGATRAALWAAQRLSCAAATHVVCVGHSLRDRARETRLIGPQEGVVIGGGTVNGIDLSRYRIDSTTRTAAARLRARLGIDQRTVVVGYLGRLARDKGIGDLRRAWELVDDRAARLLVGGTVDDTDPPDPADVAALRSERRTTLLGHVDDVPGFLAAIDLLVLPTWREGFPTVPLEAAAMAVPVVATSATGCVDAVVDGETGTLIPVQDARALSGAILRYVGDRDLRRRHGDAGVARVSARFTREKVHQATIDFYRTILATRPP